MEDGNKRSQDERSRDERALQRADGDRQKGGQRASGRHRTVRESRRHRGMSSMEDDKDQTPMELAVSRSSHGKKPTTLGGHRYIPSYDSQMSAHGLTLSLSDLDNAKPRGRSESYKPWNDRRRDPSYGSIGNLDGLNFEVSEIQDWPMEGTDNDVPRFDRNQMSVASNQPMIIAHRYRDDSVTPRAIGGLMPPSHHIVMESDDHVGDSIF